MNLSDFGAYPFGGSTIQISGKPLQDISFTADTVYQYDPNGTYAVNHGWAQYYVPAIRNNMPPLVFVHGGGMHGGMWDTKPDGQPGWLQHFVSVGYEVHIIDNVERGRAGWVPDWWEGSPILRTLEEAWSLFRFGPPEYFDRRITYAPCQFPVASLETLGSYFCPRWVSNTANQINALDQLLQRFNDVIIICHSQGSEITFEAVARRADRVRAVIAIEPSGVIHHQSTFIRIPTLVVQGDHLDCNETWRGMSGRWLKMIRELQKAGGLARVLDAGKQWPGTTHMMMMDNVSQDIAMELDGWLRRLSL